MTISEIVDDQVNLSLRAMFDKVHQITYTIQIPELYPSMHRYGE